jgi:hypothetical protein
MAFEITHVEFYHPPHIDKAEVAIMRERVKNIHYYQYADPEAFEQAMESNLIKLDNNKYFKKFNLFAN